MSRNTTAPATPLPAVLYSRVSTEDQAESGLGLTDQAEKLRAMATVKGWTSVELVDDGVSAKNLNRPAMAEALRMLGAGEAGALVVENSTVSPGRYLISGRSWNWHSVRAGRSWCSTSGLTPRPHRASSSPT